MNHETMDMYMNIGHMMLHMSRQFKMFMKKMLEGSKLNFVEAVTLLQLLKTTEETGDRLAVAVNYDKSVMTRTLQGLEARGSVNRRRNPEDGRSRLFSLTEKGQKEAEIVLRAMKTWGEIMFEDMDEKEGRELLGRLMMLSGKLDIS